MLFRSFQKSGEQSSHLPLLVDKRKETSGTPDTTGQPCMATCFYENESPSNEDLKANGSPFCGHTYQTRGDSYSCYSQLCMQCKLNF